MIKDPKNLLWIVPLAALLTMPLWKPLAADFLNPERKEAAIPSVASLTTQLGQSSTEMDGVQFEQSNHGIREWSLTASRLYSEKNDSDMQLEDVKALFYGTPGQKEETRISSMKANYNPDTRQLILKEKVIVQNQHGYEMQTESLEYVPADKKIRTTSPVRITGKNIEVSGKKLLYDTVTGSYSLSGNVVCRLW
jgi:LPS export ABC transporter protein LptC